ncbi:PstC family ABC transporter permease [Cribrihabitans pelagius]|uniref:PstC family ABC transporter permease n=1 Tax=Cribrihabitans pelagius TaxID=1765746 RepID=UPI003B5BCE30
MSVPLSAEAAYAAQAGRPGAGPRAPLAERLLRAVLATVFALGCLTVLVVAWVILRGAAPALAAIPLLQFLTDPDWYPTRGLFDLKPMLAGSLLASLGAVAIATPVSVMLAAAMQFFLAPLAAAALRRGLFVMAAMPTVILGFWGLTQVVPLAARAAPPGFALISGILVLALMIVPTTALLIDTALAKLPRPMLHGALALGAAPGLACFSMAMVVVRRAVLSAALLGLGRALGETIVVLMVTGNKAELPQGLFDPIRTLTANVALEMGYAEPLHGSVLFLSVLILFALATGLALLIYLLDAGPPTQVDV